MRKILRSVICLALAAILLAMPIFACAATTAVKICTVTEDRARLRDKNRDIITSLPQGTKVFSTDEKVGSTTFVRVSNGLEGYIYDEYLEYYGAVKLDNIYYCSAASKSIYRIADYDAAKIGSIKENQYVVVLRTRGNWAYIKNMSGKGGFCPLDDLVKVN